MRHTKVLAPIILATSILATLCAQTGAEDDVEIVFLGDTSFGENYHDLLAAVGGEPILRTRGYDYMIANFTLLLRDADFTVANLETPITDAFPSPFLGSKRYIHYSDVDEMPRQLDMHGFDLVSLANNHAFDYGARGLDQTLRLLDGKKVGTCGAGADIAAAARPHVQRFDIGARTVHVAVLCSFEYREGYDRNYGFYAGEDKAGVNPLDTDDVAATVKTLRERYPGLIVIAFPHWGRNYAWANERQRVQARALIDAGVDIIIGHGAHMIQEIERYGGRWIVYSIGNFIFGSLGRYAEFKAPPYSVVATIRLVPASDGMDVKLRLHPINSDNLATDFQPRFVTADEFDELVAILRTRSRFDGLMETGIDRYGPYLELGAGPQWPADAADIIPFSLQDRP